MSLGLSRISDLQNTAFEPGFAAPEWQGANQLPRLVLRPGTPVGETGEFCYLIERGLVASYVAVDASRPTCVGLIGPGEIVGLATVLGRPIAAGPQNCTIGSVQLLRFPAADLRTMVLDSRGLLDVCMQQLQAGLIEIQHVAACNARHLLPARCAHWLLRLQSRLGNTLPVTHEFLASVLGVRRAGITVTLQGLQRDGAIRQQRGSIVITDVERLRQAGCSCPITIERPAWPVAAVATLAPRPALSVRPGPRAWLESMMQQRSDANVGSGADPVARIDAVLQVCRNVMEQTQTILAA